MKHIEDQVDSLEDEIETLSRLDHLRIESAELREQGRRALRDHTNKGWHDVDSPIEDALIVKALSYRGERTPDELVKRITTRPGDILGNLTKIPILRAARGMQALAAMPGAVFSEALFIFYYQVVREVYSADAPGWHFGGARAATGGVATAFVTGECLRALLGFVRTLENTGRLIEEVRWVSGRKSQLEARNVSEAWRKSEELGLDRDFYTTFVSLLDGIAFKFDLPELTVKEVSSLLAKLPEQITRALKDSVAVLERAINEIDAFRKKEIGKAAKAESKNVRRLMSEEDEAFCQSFEEKQLERSETGHAVALGAVTQALERTKAAASLDFARDGKPDEKALGQLSTSFKSAADSVRRLISPIRSFLSTVLDRELAAAASPERRTIWDPAEMAFAASSYGYATKHKNWDDDRLRRAGLCLAEVLSERGLFPNAKPFYVGPEGSHFDLLGAEVLKAFAQLLQHVPDVPVDERLVKQMVLFFRDNRRSLARQSEPYGWCYETVQGSGARPIRLVTAAAVLALDRINRMLDERINVAVLRHFSVKKPDELKDLNLRNLFYPDYGLRKDGNPWREESIAVSLGRMRGHVLGVSRREPNVPALFSMVLYGPPGTGKTTLIEALAKSCGVRLVEVTPSDIVSGGEDAVERRTRAVFKALSLLTRTVILFDEFDPVLKRRNSDDQGPSNVFSFVTPGMLPKLKTLHDNAKKRGVAYALVTNLIGLLEDAAIRSGRFDARIGIYPPDPLSRAGRLIDQVLAYQEKNKITLLPDYKKRAWEVVKDTAGAPMEALTRPGWYVWPPDEGSMLPDSPFLYLMGKGTSDNIQSPEAEADFDLVRQRALAVRNEQSRNLALLEYQQWGWIRNWEESLHKNELAREEDVKSFESVLENPSYRDIPEIPGASEEAEAAYLVWGSKVPSGMPFMRLYVKPGNGDGSAGKAGAEEPLSGARRSGRRRPGGTSPARASQ